MDNYFPTDSVIQVSDAIIENIGNESSNTFVTISYNDCIHCGRTSQTVRLVVGNNTIILSETGNRIPVTSLREGMIVDASFSSAMTRSIPPQSNAFMIRIVRRPVEGNITIGRILDIDRQNRSFTTISDGNFSSIIRFNVPMNTLILDRNGRRVNFSRLNPAQRVRVRHASFMTASIPPQTTAFEIQIL